MTKSCVRCNKTFSINEADLAFYKTISVPTPTHCPTCRHQRRAAFRNEKNFYSRPCDLCKKNIVSIYSKDVAFPVYCNNCFWSDQWDPARYGRSVDYARPFFEQFRELANVVPHVALINSDSENSDYTNYSTQNKNCYMCSGTGRSENCYHGNRLTHSKDCLNCFDIFKCELCHECVQCNQCYNAHYSQLCLGCRDIDWCYDCVGCSDCFGCVGLRNKQNYILNVPFTPDEYTKKVSQLKQDLPSFLKQWEELKLKVPRKYANLVQSEKCSGNNLEHCNFAQNAFLVRDSENVSYIQIGIGLKDEMDVTVDDYSQIGYEIAGADKNYHNLFSCLVWYGQFTSYCQFCFHSKYLFGCVSLKKHQFSILNKPYSTEEAFVAERQKLITHMLQTKEYGEFFPLSLSPFPYNDSIAQIYFPLTETEVVQAGWQWGKNAERTKGKETIAADALPDIMQVDATFVNQILACEQCQTNYKFIAAEIDLMKHLGVALPKLCPLCRYRKQIELLDPFHLWQRQCMCTQVSHGHNGRCVTEFETTYSPERKELVYCETCYQKETY